MLDIKLLALDVDGTLVGETPEISPTVRHMVMRTQQAGIHICLCTGRSLAATRRYLDELQIKTPPVVFNGALVPDLRGQTALVKRTLPVALVKHLIARSREHDLYLELHTQNGFRVERLGLEGERQVEKLGIVPVVGPFGDLAHSAYILKAQFVTHTTEQKDAVIALGRELGSQAMLSWGVSPGFEGHFINIMQPGVDKQSSLDTLLTALHISWDDVFAAGDSPSDLGYIQRAGCGVVMGNAPEAVRREAPRLAGHVEQDGLAHAIARYVFDEPL